MFCIGRRVSSFLLAIGLVILSALPVSADDVFRLKPELAGIHPRILFTQEQADALWAKVSVHPDFSIDRMLTWRNVNTYSYNASITYPGQYSWWYATATGIYAALSREQTYIDKAKAWFTDLSSANWDYLGEGTISLKTAHFVAAYALLYDCIYNDLTPTEQDLGKSKLVQAIQMFHTRGYESGASGADAYWLNDYQNNHMHFRLAGSLFSLITLWGEVTTDLSLYGNNIIKYFRRLDYVMAPDGSNHEGFDYSHYGHALLTPALYAFERCIPSASYTLVNPGYHNSGNYVMHHMTPDWKTCFGFGDSGNGPSDNLNYLYHSAAHYQDPYIQKTLANMRTAINSNFGKTPQWSLLFRDETVPAGDLSLTPKHRYFDDAGIVCCRTSWTDPNATAFAFKCGPMGGRILNVTRGTEYSINTDYINVAHDDPDAGTFLVFSKGSFITTGDDYEKTAKITIHHSTLVVDGATQYGGAGGWSQPVPLSQWAWPRDYADAGELVVYTGNLKGVYPNMSKLNRTFASQGARYAVIFDDIQSNTAGRAFDWRMQTPGAATLADQGNATYKITNGNGSALVKKYAPAAASWTTASYTANDGALSLKALRLNLSGQTSQQFMVLVAPDAADLGLVTDNYDNSSTLGLKVSLGGKTEYTLFAKTSAISAGDVTATANTVLTSEDEAGSRLEYAAISNGSSFTYRSVSYFSSDTKVSIGLDYASGAGSGGIFTVRASSESDTAGGAQITIGGLAASTSYPVSINGTGQGNSSTNAGGELTVSVTLDAESRIVIGTVTGIPDDPAARRPAVTAVSLVPNPLDLAMARCLAAAGSYAFYSLSGKPLDSARLQQAGIYLVLDRKKNSMGRVLITR